MPRILRTNKLGDKYFAQSQYEYVVSIRVPVADIDKIKNVPLPNGDIIDLLSLSRYEVTTSEFVDDNGTVLYTKTVKFCEDPSKEYS